MADSGLHERLNKANHSLSTVLSWLMGQPDTTIEVDKVQELLDVQGERFHQQFEDLVRSMDDQYAKRKEKKALLLQRREERRLLERERTMLRNMADELGNGALRDSITTMMKEKLELDASLGGLQDTRVGLQQSVDDKVCLFKNLQRLTLTFVPASANQTIDWREVKA